VKVYSTYIGINKPNITIGTKVRINADSLTPFFIVGWWNWIDTPTSSGLSAIYRFESCPDYKTNGK